jgi:hypothetical protein
MSRKMKKRKSWQEKLNDSKDLPKIAKFGKTPKSWPAGTYIIPAPLQVDAIMKKVPKGKLITINEIREILAKKHGTDFACPITTGIFSWIAANAAAELAAEGKKKITPYWRTLKTGGLLNEKYPGGTKGLMKLLKAEGHKVVRKGKSKNFCVADYEKALVDYEKIKI